MKARFKVPDHTFHSGTDSFDFRINASPWWNRDFIDRWLKLECSFQLHLAVSRKIDALNFKEEKWRITLQKIDSDSPLIANPDPRLSALNASTEMRRKRGNNMGKSMPVLPCAVMKEKQVFHPITQARVRRAWSIVRLNGPDPLYEVVREFSFVQTGLFKTFFGVTNREFEAIWFGGRIGKFEEYCGLIDRGIKSSPHVVKELAQFKSETVIPRNLCHSTHASICPIAIWLSNKFIGIWLGDSLPFSLKGFEVKACPIQSLPTLRE